MIPWEARRAATVGGVAGIAAALVPIACAWGFSVDDSWITARVAAHIARGFGHRFNIGGPVVDAVTPLGFAYVLAPLSGGDPARALRAAQWLGVVCGMASGAWVGRELARAGNWRGLWALLPLTVSLPFAAWCVSGMETGVVVLLATLSLGRGAGAPLASGLAAALRPELAPWAVAVSAGLAFARGGRGAGLFRPLSLALTPPLLVAGIRFVVFGHAAPLAFYAKPSDSQHGAFYVLACFIWTGPPVLFFSRALTRLAREDRAVLAAAAVHLGALFLAGGDWMPFFRLFVPLLPGLFLVGGRLVGISSPLASSLRLGAAAAISLVLFFDKGGTARGVWAQRAALIRQGSSSLSGARHVAALDVGWVGAATDTDVVDLAGVTDERVARLPGGHTSKRLSERFLEQRDVDAVVLLMSGPEDRDLSRVRWSRAVEARVAREAADLGFVLRATLPLLGTSERYLVLRPGNRP